MSASKKFHRFIFVDPNLCTGCEICEAVCSFVHDGEFNPLNTRIHRVRIEPIVNIALSCQKCEDAPCIRACMENAIEKAHNVTKKALLIFDEGEEIIKRIDKEVDDNN